MDVRNSPKERDVFLECLPGVCGGEKGAAGSFAILCELGKRLRQLPA